MKKAKQMSKSKKYLIYLIAVILLCILLVFVVNKAIDRSEKENTLSGFINLSERIYRKDATIKCKGPEIKAHKAFPLPHPYSNLL